MCLTLYTRAHKNTQKKHKNTHTLAYSVLESVLVQGSMSKEGATPVVEAMVPHIPPFLQSLEGAGRSGGGGEVTGTGGGGGGEILLETRNGNMVSFLDNCLLSFTCSSQYLPPSDRYEEFYTQPVDLTRSHTHNHTPTRMRTHPHTHTQVEVSTHVFMDLVAIEVANLLEQCEFPIER